MRSLLTVLVSLATLAIAIPASGAVITGQNDLLNSKKGKVYIPNSQLNSGLLGQNYSATPDFKAGRVGMNQSGIRLSGSGTTSSGDMTFMLRFSLPTVLEGAIAKGQEDKANILLTLGDLDFRPVVNKVLRYTETLDLTLVMDPDNFEMSNEDTPDLTIDSSNYGNFRPGLKVGTGKKDNFGPTNGKKITYTINLLGDLGMSADELASINETREFGILVTLHSTSERLRNGSAKYKNTSESFAGNFQYVAGQGVPEPLTLGLLAAGSLMVLKRRRTA
jgi:hypothetical protein